MKMGNHIVQEKLQKMQLAPDMLNEIISYLSLKDIISFSHAFSHDGWKVLLKTRFNIDYYGPYWIQRCRIAEIEAEGTLAEKVARLVTMGYPMPEKMLSRFTFSMPGYETEKIILVRIMQMLKGMRKDRLEILEKETNPSNRLDFGPKNARFLGIKATIHACMKNSYKIEPSEVDDPLGISLVYFFQ